MKLKRTVASALLALSIFQLKPQSVRAQAVIGVPVVETIVVLGVVWYVWYVNGQEQRSTTYPVLPDPEEEFQEESQDIFADDLGQAQRRCKYLVENGGGEYVDTISLGKNRYRCIWRSYGG
ncbi:MAG: hypothetical protein HC781_01630 [Leptolyngbyaceae cyanobacterium CSU_1_4]|nr:hypothetical protein [Leptolyngbyaceae cyanobacterium CSU_1_4]